MSLPFSTAPSLIDLPWSILGMGLGVCLVLTAVGFRRVEYFVSLGYAASVAGLALLLPLIYGHAVTGWALVQSVLLLAYGLRLGGFILLRSRTASFQARPQADLARGAGAGMWTKIAIWLGVSLLYLLMVLPAELAISPQAAGLTLPSAPLGVVLMAVGLGLEAAADAWKSRFKQTHPSRFCDTGPFRWVRFPNYFGEMVFWLGVWVSAASVYAGPLAWGLGALGVLGIDGVMLGAGRRLEAQQGKAYGADPEFQAYARRTPILFPLLPLHSLLGAGPSPA